MNPLPPMEAPTPIKIKVVGIGGAGNNVLDRLSVKRPYGVDLAILNTDHQVLNNARTAHRIFLGQNLTRGLGAGGDPLVGQMAAEESKAELEEYLHGADLVFIVAGMGGGTGTGAAPVVAQLARDMGALTVAMVTRPFGFEGRRRQQVADRGLAQLRTIADTIVVVPNDRLIQIAGRTTSMMQAFGYADAVLHMGVQSIVELALHPGMINVDFADVRTIISDAGRALLGIGRASGDDRAQQAMRKAMACPLLEGQLEGARRVLLNITGNESMSLFEVQRAAELIGRTVDSEANIIFGAVIDPAFPPDQIKVTLIVTGFVDADPPSSPARAQARLPRIRVPTPDAVPVEAEPKPETLDFPPFLLRFR